jgi:hypothetical protein
MTLRNLFAKATAMDAHEFRTRASGALRTGAGRARFAVAPPRWRRRRILDVLDPASAPIVADACAAARHDDYLTAHRALAAHLQTRASRWPLKAARREILATDINLAFPSAAPDARAAADRVIDGRIDVLGYRGIPVGHPPRWDRDEIHNRTAPACFWADVPYLDPAAGDHKLIWELNRHQHFLVLGAAYWLTNDPRYRTACIRQLEDWVRLNPPLAGINWASMLELAFRAISWTWAVEFLAPGADSAGANAGANDDEEPWLVDLFVSLDRQLTHIGDNLSIYFSPNTHLSGEALALYAVSLAFPEFRRSAARVATGRGILLREADRQVRGDGGHAEQSPHYHRYSTDFYLLACMMARAADDSAASAFERTAHRQAAYLRTISSGEGRLPLIGDDDGGRLFRFDARPSWDAASTLSAAAALLSDPSLAVRPPDAEVCWILGERPDMSLGERTIAWPSRLLADTGYFVSRSGPHHLIFDAGPHGFLNGGHAHSDALSVVLMVDGRPVLVDAGTATYTMDRAVRDRFRSARMHNTVVLDGVDPSQSAGPFHWRTRSDGRVLVARAGPDQDFAVGALAETPIRHIRAVLTVHGTGWMIVDRIASRDGGAAEAWWHVHPDWRVRQIDGGVELSHASGAHLGMAFTSGDVMVTCDPEIAAFSPEYGRVDVGTAVRVRRAEPGPFTVATFIPVAHGRGDALRIREVRVDARAGTGWTPAAFAIEAGGMEIAATLAFPDDPEAQPLDGWPQPCIELRRVRAPKVMTVCAE